MPKMLDLFCGTKSMAKAFERAGWETYTVDWEKNLSQHYAVMSIL